MQGTAQRLALHLRCEAQRSSVRCKRVLGAHLTLVYIISIISTMRKYNLYLPDRQIRALENMSEQLGISVSEIIRRALDFYIGFENSKFETDTMTRSEGVEHDESN